MKTKSLSMSVLAGVTLATSMLTLVPSASAATPRINASGLSTAQQANTVTLDASATTPSFEIGEITRTATSTASITPGENVIAAPATKSEIKEQLPIVKVETVASKESKDSTKEKDKKDSKDSKSDKKTDSTSSKDSKDNKASSATTVSSTKTTVKLTETASSKARRAAKEKAAKESAAQAMTRDSRSGHNVKYQNNYKPLDYSSEGKGMQDVVKHAFEGIGTPYVWGGETPRGWDCSGFVKYVYGQSGISIARGTSAILASGQFVKTDDPQPGDLVFQNGGGHVGIYVGDGKMIGAQNPSVGTILHDVTRNPLYGYYTLKSK